MKTATFDDLTFELRESPKRRTLEIIIDRDGSLVLATPAAVPMEALEQFVDEQRVWIYTKLEEKQGQARPKFPREYVSGEGFPYLGRSYRLKLVDGASQQPPLRLYRSHFELRRDVLPKARDHFIRWYTIHLRLVLDRQIAALSHRIDAEPREVHIRDLGYRWASCNKRRHLYFHWRMAMLPHLMIEYLVAHELVHLVERRHSSAFWERLERVIPDHASRQQWLKENGGKYDL
ncbi:MAG: M48 family metallopeptidase [Chloroflexi bacterium]|nr:M48 family metallopeptidase [Chloroflexota bacterium]